MSGVGDWQGEYGDTRSRYSRDYLTPDMWTSIKPTDMEKLMQFTTEIHSHVIISGNTRISFMIKECYTRAYP